MNTSIDLDALAIDGTKLRQAREQRGLSVAEVAALCTLSREQVQHIEDGGVRPFYTPAHKLLAIRKYAAAMGIPYDDIVTGPGADETMPVPADAPPSLMVHGEGEEATDLRLAAVERNADIRRKILIGAVTATIVLAFYAKLRGTPETATDLTQPVVAEAEAEVKAEAERVERLTPHAPHAPMTAAKATNATNAATSNAAAAAAASASAPAAAPGAATATAAATNAAVATASAAKPSAPAVTPATTTPATTAAPTTAAPTTATPTATASSAGTRTEGDSKPAAAESCADPVTGDVKTWTPTYQRRADTRLFLVSPKETTVCVHDASGKAALLKLKARSGQAYSGKPPYVVQSPQLSEIEIYLHGMRARVPQQAPALRLQLSPVTSPPAASDAG